MLSGNSEQQICPLLSLLIIHVSWRLLTRKHVILLTGIHLTHLKKNNNICHLCYHIKLNYVPFFCIVQYILNVRYAIGTYVQVQKELRKKQKKTSIIHIYISTSIQMSRWACDTPALVKGTRHVLRPKGYHDLRSTLADTSGFETRLWPSSSRPIHIYLYIHTQHSYSSASAWRTLSSNGINTLLTFIYKTL